MCAIFGVVTIDRQVEEYGDEVFDKLSKGAHIYFCGLKGMMPGILNMLQSVAESKKLNWESFLGDLKKKGENIIISAFFFFGGGGTCNMVSFLIV